MCPCENEALCKPISGDPVRSQEVFGFLANPASVNSSAMNWTYVTSVAWGSLESVCEAHKHGVRVILPSPRVVLTSNATERAKWVANALQRVQETFSDGLTFDFESPVPVGGVEAEQYSLLVEETTAAFHKFNPSLQISVCVAWSPDDIDGRGYDVKRLSDGSDILYVMDYDTRSQIFDACIASANAPFPGMIHGLQRYQDLGVSLSKVVLGVPWYGYRYPCENGTLPDARYCPIKGREFRGVNCSDAAGSEVGLSYIANLKANATVEGWDENMALWFNAINNEGLSSRYGTMMSSRCKKFAEQGKRGPRR